MRRLLTRVLIYVVVAWLTLLAVAHWRWADFLFVPPPPSYSATDPGVVVVDGIALRYHPPRDALHPILLYSHGNAEDLAQVWPHLEPYRRLGWGVLLYDYPGYGVSSGEVSVSGARQAALTAYDWLMTQDGIMADRILAMGRSVGGALAIHQAIERPVAGLILDSAFSASQRVVLPCHLLPGEPFNNAAALRSYPGPTLIMHGRRDRLITPAHAERLQAAAAGEVTLHWFDDLGHNDAASLARAQVVWAWWPGVERI
ncbi:MAG: alpha/beta hydrolase, partial [Planctomycetota bacterium]